MHLGLYRRRLLYLLCHGNIWRSRIYCRGWLRFILSYEYDFHQRTYGGLIEVHHLDLPHSVSGLILLQEITFSISAPNQ
jgi:hypothetical protein